MTTLDELLEAARAPGQIIERGRFRLADGYIAKARQSLSPARPGQFATEVVMAAHFAGASLISATAVPGTATLAWVGGDTIDVDAIARLFEHLFLDEADPAARPVQHLAFAVNGALLTGASSVRLTVGTGGRGLVLTASASGQLTLERPSRPVHGAVLSIHRTRSWWERLWWPENTAVFDELMSRCAYTGVPILIDDIAPFGLVQDAPIPLLDARGETTIRAPGVRGTLGIGDRPGVRLVVGGVWVSTRALRGLHPRLVGVVCDDRLRRTADLTDVVEDEAFERMVDAIAPTAREAASRADRSLAGSRASTPWVRPRIAPTTAGAAPTTASTIPMLPPRGPMARATLARTLAAGPVFVVSTRRSETLRVACDPTRFPHPVLVLDDVEAERLRQDVPGLIPLTSPSEVDAARARFAPTAAPRCIRFASALIAQVLGLDDASEAEIAVRWTPGSAATSPSGPVDADHAPLLVVAGGRCLACTAVRCDLPECTVTLTLPARPDAPLDALARAVALALRRDGWRAILEEVLPMQDDVAAAALAVGLRAASYPEPGDRPALAVVIAPRRPVPVPPDDPLLDTPLARGPDRPLTLRRWVAALRDGRAIDLGDWADASRLAPLARRLDAAAAGGPIDPAVPPPQGWRVTVPLDEAGLAGWLALPRGDAGPPSIWIDGGEARLARADLAAELGCWGEILLRGHRAPTPAQRGVLRRTATLLYASLLAPEAGRWEEDPALRELAGSFAEHSTRRNGALAGALRDRLGRPAPSHAPSAPPSVDPRAALIAPLREALSELLDADVRIVLTRVSPPPDVPQIVSAVLAPPRLSIAVPERAPWSSPASAPPELVAHARLSVATAIALWLRRVRPELDPARLSAAALVGYLDG